MTPPPGEPADPDAPPRSGLMALLRETAVVVVLSLLIATIVRIFLIQAFLIPSQSMEDTLRVDDRVMVSKLTMRFGEIHRGDVIVFADPGGWLSEPVADTGAGAKLRSFLEFVGVLPDRAEGHLIKRVIGVPGDMVVCCDADGHLRINRVVIEEAPVVAPGEPASLDEFAVTVPDGQLWVMGDNRGNSADSRVHGLVPLSSVTGRAFAVVWPFDHWTSLDRPDVYREADLGTGAP